MSMGHAGNPIPQLFMAVGLLARPKKTSYLISSLTTHPPLAHRRSAAPQHSPPQPLQQPLRVLQPPRHDPLWWVTNQLPLPRPRVRCATTPAATAAAAAAA